MNKSARVRVKRPIRTPVKKAQPPVRAGKILLTGATGFLGSHLLKTLLDETADEIIVLKRSFSDVKRIRRELRNPRVTVYNTDKTPLEEISLERADTIVHCATEYGREDNSCYKVLDTNLMFPIKLLELGVKNGVRTFINTDSYFNKNHLSYSYLLNYSLSKKSLNLWLNYFSKRIQVINMVLEHIYGEGDNPDKFVEHMIQNIAVKQVPRVDLSPGEQKRDFIFVQDVCAAYLQAVAYGRTRSFQIKKFDVGTGLLTSVKTFVQTVKRLSGSKTKLNFGRLPYREDEIMASRAGKNRLPRNKRFYSVRQGIGRIIKLYQEEGLCQ